MTHLQRIFVKLSLEVFNFLNLFRKFDSNTKPERETTARTDLTVRLLVSGASSGTSELLGLALPGIGDEQGSVVLDQDVLDGLLALLINVCKDKKEYNVTLINSAEKTHCWTCIYSY